MRRYRGARHDIREGMIVNPLDSTRDLERLGPSSPDGVLRVRIREERETVGWPLKKVVHSLYLAVEMPPASAIALRSAPIPDDEILVRGPRGLQTWTKGDLLHAGTKGIETKFVAESVPQRILLEQRIEEGLKGLAGRVPGLRSVAVLRRIQRA